MSCHPSRGKLLVDAVFLSGSWTCKCPSIVVVRVTPINSLAPELGTDVTVTLICCDLLTSGPQAEVWNLLLPVNPP